MATEGRLLGRGPRRGGGLEEGGWGGGGEGARQDCQSGHHGIKSIVGTSKSGVRSTLPYGRRITCGQ
jgi:hypothetical protein